MSRILIVVEGGNVSQVVSCGEPVEFIIQDHDNLKDPEALERYDPSSFDTSDVLADTAFAEACANI